MLVCVHEATHTCSSVADNPRGSEVLSLRLCCVYTYINTHMRAQCVCTCVSLLPCLSVDVTPGARGIRRAARHTADTCSARPMTAWLSVVAAGCLIAQLCGGLWLLAAWSLSR